LNEAKVEIRIQLREVPGNLYSGLGRNELVLRVQPKEAVYLKFINKVPGLSSQPTISELDLTYNQRYPEAQIPDAYESLILDALHGDKSNFVRDDELDAAWQIFTPLLHQIEKEKIAPLKYSYGSRGPAEATALVEKFGYVRQADYAWSPSQSRI
jgi:glucose-6-phosphate 1-dehydrogenase